MNRPADFRPAGSVDGIPLVVHQCWRTHCDYVSAEPSPDGAEYVVPFCGCRPRPTISGLVPGGSCRS